MGAVVTLVPGVGSEQSQRSAGWLRHLSLGAVAKCINIIATVEQYKGPQWCCGGMNAPLVSNINKNIQ